MGTIYSLYIAVFQCDTVWFSVSLKFKELLFFVGYACDIWYKLVICFI